MIHTKSVSRIAILVAAIVHVGLPVSPATAASSDADDPKIAERVKALQEAALASVLLKEQRIFKIGERLRTSGLDLCPDERRMVWGIITATEYELVLARLAEHKTRREAAHDVEILWIQTDSAADRAGLAVGDVIVTVDGRSVKKSQQLYRRIRKQDRASVSVGIRRGGEERVVSMPLEFGCFTAAGLSLSESINAFMNYDGIYLTAGMLRFATGDDELAVILGHEFGHGILQAFGKKDFEADADYIGLYLAARAGFDIEAAPGFWERMAIRNPFRLIRDDDIGFRTHPRTPGRALSLEATIREIRAKQMAGLPLEPEVPE